MRISISRENPACHHTREQAVDDTLEFVVKVCLEKWEGEAPAEPHAIETCHSSVLFANHVQRTDAAQRELRPPVTLKPSCNNKS